MEQPGNKNCVHNVKAKQRKSLADVDVIPCGGAV